MSVKINKIESHPEQMEVRVDNVLLGRLTRNGFIMAVIRQPLLIHPMDLEIVAEKANKFRAEIEIEEGEYLFPASSW